MTYATPQDITDLYGPDALIATDVDGDGVVDMDQVNKSLASASAEIDSYLAARYTLPIAGTHPYLVQLCVDIAIYRQSNARSFVTEEVRTRYEDAVKALRAYADGKASLVLPVDPDAPDGAADDAGPQPMLLSGPDRVFSRDKMRGL